MLRCWCTQLLGWQPPSFVGALPLMRSAGVHKVLEHRWNHDCVALPSALCEPKYPRCAKSHTRKEAAIPQIQYPTHQAVRKVLSSDIHTSFARKHNILFTKNRQSPRKISPSPEDSQSDEHTRRRQPPFPVPFPSIIKRLSSIINRSLQSHPYTPPGKSPSIALAPFPLKNVLERARRERSCGHSFVMCTP